MGTHAASLHNHQVQASIDRDLEVRHDRTDGLVVLFRTERTSGILNRGSPYQSRGDVPGTWLDLSEPTISKQDVVVVVYEEYRLTTLSDSIFGTEIILMMFAASESSSAYMF